MVVCYVGIGSNIGNRRVTIHKALQQMNALRQTKIIKMSKIIETLPQGGPVGQRKYCNGVAKIETSIPPFQLLQAFKKIEKSLGRLPGVRWGPRTIDLDILFYGDRIIQTNTLTVPHPRILERDFVLAPLSEVI